MAITLTLVDVVRIEPGFDPNRPFQTDSVHFRAGYSGALEVLTENKRLMRFLGRYESKAKRLK